MLFKLIATTTDFLLLTHTFYILYFDTHTHIQESNPIDLINYSFREAK